MQFSLFMTSLRTAAAVGLATATFAARPACAQPMQQAPIAQASRADLEKRAEGFERIANFATTKAEARKAAQKQLDRVRKRLADGDFVPGDRVFIRIRGDSAFPGDTVVVREGPALALGLYGEIPLHGVLRSELHDRVEAQVGKLIRRPEVVVTTFVRVAVFGRVLRPGYYSLPPDAPVGDALMLAGGPSPDADMERLELKRDTEVLVDAPEMRQAMARGLTLDQLDVRPGDAITVGERKQHNYSAMLQMAAVLLGSVTAVLALSRR